MASGWTVETLNQVVDGELGGLAPDLRARFVRIAQLIEAVGLPRVGAPFVRHVRGAIWEIRLAGQSGIARSLYVTANERRVVVVRVFVKKTRRVPCAEIDLALQRAKGLAR